jgi:serine/threonine protein kinase
MAPVTLPYYRERHALPADLPTQQDIENSSEHLPCHRDARFDRVVVVKQIFVVKYGIYMSENEGYALLFIEEQLRIPAPRLYAMYREGRTLYIVMEFIPGENLQQLWPKLEEEDKVTMALQLRAICDQMRALPSLGYFGSVSRGPYLQRWFRTVTPDPLINGPFESSAEVVLALARRSQQNWRENHKRSFTSEWFARHLGQALGGCKSVFTHAYLHPQNILVRKEATGPNKEHERYVVSAIVDWETAGWYPDYWEYAGSFVDFIWCDDWPEKYELIVEARPMEAALLRWVREDLDH